MLDAKLLILDASSSITQANIWCAACFWYENACREEMLPYPVLISFQNVNQIFS